MPSCNPTTKTERYGTNTCASANKYSLERFVFMSIDEEPAIRQQKTTLLWQTSSEISEGISKEITYWP